MNEVHTLHPHVHLNSLAVKTIKHLLLLLLCTSATLCYAIPADSISAANPTVEGIALTITPADTTLPIAARPSIFRRFYNYFANANEDKTELKKFDFSIIGGPHYSSDVKLGLGLVAAGLYRIDKENLSLSPSNVSLFGDITTSGFYLLGIRGNTIFKDDKSRLEFNAYFFSMPSAFWGVGYDNAQYGEVSSYKRKQNQVKADYMFRMAKNFYLGVGGSFNYIEGKDFSRIEYLKGADKAFLNVGAGISLLYDSRDFIPNAYKGIYARLDQRFFPNFLGNKGAFMRTEFFGNAYKQVWKGGVLAYDLHAQFNYGSTPWTMLALMGGSNRMRGYYEGRYRDNNLIETQLELRQRVYRRNFIAVWGGAGNVFPSLNHFNGAHTLPNYGIGYRWEFKKRVNVRLDYGFGKKGQSSFIFNINEAF